MATMSKKLKVAIKLSSNPAYKIAQKANLDPSTLSKLICGIVKIRSNDPRVIAIGRVLGIPATECFDKEMEKNNEETRSDYLP